MKIFFDKNFLNALKALYLWILALLVGGIFALGAFSASVIFNAEILGVNLPREQAGILMSAIFSRFNVILIFSAFVISFYEILYCRLSDSSAINKILLGASGAICVVCAFLFALYYSPNIIALQEAGSVDSAQFEALHAQSEWVFHILFFSASFNLIYRVIRG